MTDRPPTTLHEHFIADPRGADSFGRWIEDRIWELLQKQAQIEFLASESMLRWYWIPLYGTVSPATAAECIMAATTEWTGGTRRVVLPDGTIIKEWAGTSAAATDRSSNPDA